MAWGREIPDSGHDGSPQYQDFLSVGAFADSTSDNIFTDKNKGILA